MYTICKHVRHHRTKGSYSKRSFSGSDTRSSSSVPRHHQAVHHEDKWEFRFGTRPGLYVGVSRSGLCDEDAADPRGSRGPRGDVRIAQPWATFIDPRKGPTYIRDARSYPGVRGRVRVSAQDFSSVLLDRMEPKYLVLGPGGMGFYAMLGACSAMWDEIKNVEEISGASAGAILGLFLGLGMSPSDICEFTLDTDTKDLATYNIRTFLDKYGLIDHSQIRERLISICEGNPTFSDLPKKVHISAFNVNLGRTEYFSRDTHPTMPVIDAVCMSMSVPFLFSSFKYRDYLYIDGGIMERFPGTPFVGKNPQEVLVIKTITSSHTGEINNFKQFVNALVIAALRNSRQSYEGTTFRVVNIDVTGVNVFDFTMSHEDRLKLFLMFNYNK